MSDVHMTQAVIGRIQWSKYGITVYDGNGGFVCRLEQPWERNFFNVCIIEALKQISLEQQKLFKAGKASNGDPHQEVTRGAVASEVGSQAGTEDSGVEVVGQAG